MYGPSGWFPSPDMDDDGYYDSNLYCTWIIRVAEKHAIRFTFLFFAVIPSQGCEEDRLLVSTWYYEPPHGKTNNVISEQV